MKMNREQTTFIYFSVKYINLYKLGSLKKLSLVNQCILFCATLLVEILCFLTFFSGYNSISFS